MRMHRPILCLLGVLPLLWGCDQQALFQKLVPQAEAEAARRLFSQLAAGDLETVEKQLDPQIRTPDLRGTLGQMAAMFPPGDPKGINTVGSHTSTSNGITTYNLTFETVAFPLGAIVFLARRKRLARIVAEPGAPIGGS
jgi:hypothetical protein